MPLFPEILLCVLLASGGVFTFFVMAESADFRILRRTIRQPRFGLKTAFGMTAILAGTFGFASMLGMDFRDPGVICALMVGAPLAIFAVGLAGLVLSELFDTKSTRAIVARRHLEDELTVYARERDAGARNELEPSGNQVCPTRADGSCRQRTQDQCGSSAATRPAA